MLLLESVPESATGEGHGLLVLQGSVKQGTFAAYAPASREVELCDVPDLLG